MAIRGDNDQDVWGPWWTQSHVAPAHLDLAGLDAEGEGARHEQGVEDGALDRGLGAHVSTRFTAVRTDVWFMPSSLPISA